MRKWIAITVLCLASPQVWAQHQHEPTIIDGAKHPELIPDNNVYLGVFMNFSLPRNPTSNDIAFQQGVVDSLKLNAADRANLVVIAQGFRSAFDIWRVRHDAYQQLEDLISASRADLKRVLSSDGQKAVDRYVALARARTKIYKGGAQ